MAAELTSSRGTADGPNLDGNLPEPLADRIVDGLIDAFQFTAGIVAFITSQRYRTASAVLDNPEAIEYDCDSSNCLTFKYKVKQGPWTLLLTQVLSSLSSLEGDSFSATLNGKKINPIAAEKMFFRAMDAYDSPDCKATKSNSLSLSKNGL
jgi:hypothetical protein